MADSVSGWRIVDYGALGWVETAVKSVGILIGLAAFAATAPEMPLILAGNPRIAAILLLALAILICLVALGLRWRLKDIVAMVYAAANLIGHLALMIALLRAPENTALPVLFGAAYLAGDAVKLYWLRVSGYVENGMSAAGMRRLVYGVMAVYAAFVVALVL